MGNTSAVESKNKQLVIRNRLLERQASQHLQIDQVTRSKIADVKKNHKYTNLIFAGSAVKSLAYVGALGYLHDKHYLANICNIACSGFSTFFAVLYSIGYSPPELKQIAELLDLHSIISKDVPLVSDIFHVASSEYGLNNGQHLMDTIADLIERKTGRKHYNMEDLLKEKGINLVATVADLTSGSVLYFWHRDYPKLPLRILVRMACCTPLVYAPVIFDGHYLADSLVIDRCPIRIFDGSTPADPGSEENPYTLCLLTIGDLPMDNDMGSRKPDNTHNVLSYLSSIVNTMSESITMADQRPSFWLRTAPIHVPCYPMCHYNITQTQKLELMSLGYSEMRKFLD